MEGWLNTTGNILNIREWLGKNKFGAESANQFVSSPSIDIPEEMRPNSFTIGHETLYDKSGYAIKHPVKYPTGSHLSEQDLHLANRSWPNEQRVLESGLSSLQAINISDCNLYGEDGHSTSEAGSSDYIELEMKYIVNKQEGQGYNITSHRCQDVISRGGYVVVPPKGRVGEIMERRKKRYPMNSNPASSIIKGGIVDIEPTQALIADTTSDATMPFRVTCDICCNYVYAQPAHYCRNCWSKVCNECFNILLNRPCAVGTKHDLYQTTSYVSSV